MEFLQLKLLEAGRVSGEVSCNSYSSCFLEIHLSLPRDRMHSQMTLGSYFATCLLLIIFVQLCDPGMDTVQAARFSWWVIYGKYLFLSLGFLLEDIREEWS